MSDVKEMASDHAIDIVLSVSWSESTDIPGIFEQKKWVAYARTRDANGDLQTVDVSAPLETDWRVVISTAIDALRLKMFPAG